MNSIEEKRNNTTHEILFDKKIRETKKQIDQINKGIEIKKHLGENTFCHYSVTKNFYLDEVTKYFEGKGYTVQLLPTEAVVSYKINIVW